MTIILMKDLEWYPSWRDPLLVTQQEPGGLLINVSLTLWVRHLLHGCGCHHDGHGQLVTQNRGAQVLLAHVYQNARLQPAHKSYTQGLCISTCPKDACLKRSRWRKGHKITRVSPHRRNSMQRDLGKRLLNLHLRRTVDHGQQNEKAKLPQSQ